MPADYAWPGNVRELEQAIRRILLSHQYRPEARRADGDDDLVEAIDGGTVSAADLLHRYCAKLYARYGTYEEVARRTKLDRRTVKKYVEGDL